jgi:hypothetical protein
MKSTLPLIIALIFSTGCSSSFEGIRIRARAPGMDEAFRKIRIAMELDGFTVAAADPATYVLETAWRVVREDEQGKGDGAAGEVRMRLDLKVRGTMYDVLLAVFVRRTSGDGAGRETAVPAGHPLAVKWQRILSALVERESKEED